MPISADLGANLEAVVEDLVKNGRYGSKSEVLREGVRLVQEREAALEDLIGKLEHGIAELDSGLGIEGEAVFDSLEAKYRKLADEDDARGTTHEVTRDAAKV